MSTLLRQTTTTSTSPDATPDAAVPRWLPLIWMGFVVAALLMLPALPLVTWGVVVPIVAAALLAATAPAARGLRWLRRRADAVDLFVIGGLYLAVVGLYRLAFVVFTTDNVLGLFLSFAGGLILGVVGPVAYTTWIRHRPLRIDRRIRRRPGGHRSGHPARPPDRRVTTRQPPITTQGA